MIRIQRSNGNYDYVKPSFLDAMLDCGQVISFRREGGICLVSVDPIRSHRNNNVFEEDRRRV